MIYVQTAAKHLQTTDPLVAVWQCGLAKLSKNKQLRSKFLDKESKEETVCLKEFAGPPIE